MCPCTKLCIEPTIKMCIRPKEENIQRLRWVRGVRGPNAAARMVLVIKISRPPHWPPTLGRSD